MLNYRFSSRKASFITSPERKDNEREVDWRGCEYGFKYSRDKKFHLKQNVKYHTGWSNIPLQKVKIRGNCHPCAREIISFYFSEDAVSPSAADFDIWNCFAFNFFFRVQG